MKSIDVVKRGDEWIAESGSRAIAKAAKKQQIIKEAAQLARKSPDPTSVRIHKVDGRIQEERTYPRSADPRRSKG
jgi:Uncharacterized protein conserved in bacteria (DUF2188)